MENVTLMGAEKVAQAARDMEAAAESFRRTVGYLDEILRSFQAANLGAIVTLNELLETDRKDRRDMINEAKSRRLPPGAIG